MAKRLEITYDGKEHFPAPMRFSLAVPGRRQDKLPDMSNYSVARQWISDCIEECEEAGFSFNAIVAKRPTQSGEQWRAQSHLQWGVIESLNRNHYDPRDPDWKPIRVRWIQPNAHEGKTNEDFFPEELYLIHPHVEVPFLLQMFKIQDGE